jgi:hypothetical protein
LFSQVARDEERVEREERRGLEARGGAVLAAGATAVGLVATAIRELRVTGAERDSLLALVAVGSGVMAVALALATVGLVKGKIPREPDEPPGTYAKRVRKNNEEVVGWLRWATGVFVAAVLCLLGALIWAAWASAPSPTPPTPKEREEPVTVTVKSLKGERGERGPRGYTGPKGVPGCPTAPNAPDIC